MPSVFIDGEQGTTGLRIVSRLAARPELTLLSLPQAQRKELSARAELAARADAAILCLPDDASRELVAALGGAGRVLDASTAFRTDPRFAYGFPELSAAHARAIAQSDRIAVPGCHASGAIALIYPLVAAGLLAPDAPLCLTSLTGYSGGGKRMIAQYEAEARERALDAPRYYGVEQTHKHLPEIQSVCGLARPPVLQPIVCDFYSGMLVSLLLPSEALRAPGAPQALTDLYRAHYAGKPLVDVLPPNPEPFVSANALAGKDTMQIFVTGNPDRMIACARFDNLGKGASGAAVQCLNLRLGLPETAGLAL